MKKAIIVVDVQNGFVHPQGTLYCGDSAGEIIPRISARLELERAEDAAIFFTQDSHVENDAEFAMFPPHCIEGSEDEKIVEELTTIAAQAQIVKKRRYSAF
jgi:nicotinamidase-related amidase